MDELQQAVQDACFEVNRKAQDLKEQIAAYAQHLRLLGDPQKLPDGSSWYHNPIQDYAQEIVNVWRSGLGMVANPYHPANRAYTLFDKLLDHWVAGSELSRTMYGSRVTSYIRDHSLRAAGYELQKETMDGRVHYRIVKLEAVA